MSCTNTVKLNEQNEKKTIESVCADPIVDYSTVIKNNRKTEISKKIEELKRVISIKKLYVEENKDSPNLEIILREYDKIIDSCYHSIDSLKYSIER